MSSTQSKWLPMFENIKRFALLLFVESAKYHKIYAQNASEKKSFS